MINERLAAYCNDDMPLSERLLLEAELEQDNQHVEDIFEQEAMSRFLAVVHEDGRADANVLRAAMMSIESLGTKKNDSVWFSGSGMQRGFAFVAAAAVLFIMTWSLFLQEPNQDSARIVSGRAFCSVYQDDGQQLPSSQLTTGQRLQVKTDTRICLNWDDGTWMNIRGPAELWMGGDRHQHALTLQQGHITATVSKQMQPMIIQTVHGQAVIRGTVFDLLVNEHRTALCVESGVVDLVKGAQVLSVTAGKAALANTETLEDMGAATVDNMKRIGKIIWEERFQKRTITEQQKNRQVIELVDDQYGSYISVDKGSLNVSSLFNEQEPFYVSFSEQFIVNLCCRVEANTSLSVTMRSYEGEYSDDDKNLVTKLCSVPLSNGGWQTLTLPLSAFRLAKPSKKENSEAHAYWSEHWQERVSNVMNIHCDPETRLQVKWVSITTEE